MPLSNFFEEKLSYQLDDKKPNALMRALFISLAATGLAGSSDLVDEMLRQVQKSKAFDQDQPGQVKPLFGHPFIHRLLKDMVKAEVTHYKSQKPEERGKLKFSQSMSKILMKSFEDAIKGRGIFILIELIENEETKDLVEKQLKA